MKGYQKLNKFIHFVSLISISSLIVVSAHPHNWISMATDFVIDSEGLLDEIHQQWTFDVYYSTLAIADLENQYGSLDVGLKLMGQQMVENLLPHHYFSHLKIEGVDEPLPFPNRHLLSSRKDDNGRRILSLSMTFEMDRQLPLKNSRLSYRVYDPTFYIDMSYQDLTRIRVSHLGDFECVKQLEDASPTAQIIEYASSLDQSETSIDGLGEKFAQTFELHCE